MGRGPRAPTPQNPCSAAGGPAAPVARHRRGSGFLKAGSFGYHLGPKPESSTPPLVSEHVLPAHHSSVCSKFQTPETPGDSPRPDDRDGTRRRRRRRQRHRRAAAGAAAHAVRGAAARHAREQRGAEDWAGGGGATRRDAARGGRGAPPPACLCASRRPPCPPRGANARPLAPAGCRPLAHQPPPPATPSSRRSPGPRATPRTAACALYPRRSTCGLWATLGALSTPSAR